MRIASSQFYFPDSSLTTDDRGYGLTVPKANANLNALEMLVPLVSKILHDNKLKASSIDLIVSLSMSPDHLVSETEIMGPRIGHPLQKAIGAEKAFVFDLMDSSLAKALYIINTLALTEGYTRILIVRTELSLSLKSDANSGFSIADGASAMLVEPMSGQIFESRALDGEFTPLVMELNPNITAATDFKAELSLPYQQNLQQAFMHSADEILSDPKWHSDTVAIEHWLSPSVNSHFSFGPFELFRCARQRLDEQIIRNMTFVSFDPFYPNAEAVSIELVQSK